MINIIGNIILSATSAAVSIISRIVTDGLKMWLPFERSEIVSSTQVAPDTSGNSNNATLYTGKALSFDGVNDYIGFGSDINSNGTVWTVAFWISDYTPTTYAWIVGNVTNKNIGLRRSGTQKVFYRDNSSVYNDFDYTGFNSSFTAAKRFVMSSDGTDISLYIDGEFIDSITPTSTLLGVSRFMAGYNSTQYLVNATTSDFQLWGVPWTQADVTYDYNKPNHLVTDNPSTSIALSNLKGYWALSEGDGAIAYDSGTPLGSEEIIDGDFSPTSPNAPNFNDWTKGSNWSISGGYATSDGLVAGNLDQYTLTIGKHYKVTLDVSGVTTSTLSVRLGGTNQIGNISVNGTHTFYGTADGTAFRLRSAAGFDGSVDNISVKEVSIGTINGATHVDQQSTIPQLGMMDWAKSTPLSDEITLIADPNNPSQDILGNSVRLREHSLNLDGSGYAEVADNDSLNMSSGFSVDFWVKLNSDERQWFVTKGTAVNSSTGQSDKGFGTTILNNKIYATVNTSVKKYQVNTTTLSASGQWIYVCVTYEDATNGLKLYINQDSPIIIQDTPSGTIDETHNLVIGGNYQKIDNFASNQIDSVRFYNRPLSSDEVARNYKVGEVSHKTGSSFSDDFSSDYGN